MGSLWGRRKCSLRGWHLTGILNDWGFLKVNPRWGTWRGRPSLAIYGLIKCFRQLVDIIVKTY